MDYLIWKLDRQDGQAMIYDGWPALSVSFSRGDFITNPVPMIEITMNEKSQGFMTDNLIVVGAPPIFSDRMISVLTDAGVNNIQTFPCKIINNITGEIFDNYKVINVIGKISCLDINNSEVEFLDSEKTKILLYEYLTLDESKIGEQLFFVLSEMPVQIIVHKKVVKMLQDAEITGVDFIEQGDLTVEFPPII